MKFSHLFTVSVGLLISATPAGATKDPLILAKIPGLESDASLDLFERSKDSFDRGDYLSTANPLKNPSRDKHLNPIRPSLDWGLRKRPWGFKPVEPPNIKRLPNPPVDDYILLLPSRPNPPSPPSRSPRPVTKPWPLPKPPSPPTVSPHPVPTPPFPPARPSLRPLPAPPRLSSTLLLPDPLPPPSPPSPAFKGGAEGGPKKNIPHPFVEREPICIGSATCGGPISFSTYNAIKKFFEEALTAKEVSLLPEKLRSWGGSVIARALAEALEEKQRENVHGPLDHSKLFIFRPVVPECQGNSNCRSPVAPLPPHNRYRLRIEGYNAASNIAPLKGAQLFLNLIEANLDNFRAYFELRKG